MLVRKKRTSALLLTSTASGFLILSPGEGFAAGGQGRAGEAGRGRDAFLQGAAGEEGRRCGADCGADGPAGGRDHRQSLFILTPS